MKRMVALLIVGLLLSLTVASCVSANDEENPATNHSPFYVGSKPFVEYEEPGFVCGFYNRIDWRPYSNNTSVRYLYSPHLLFGWNFQYLEYPHILPWFLQIAAFSSRVLFQSFRTTFVGFFTGTEPGFICGFVEGNCYFTYGFYPHEATN